MPHGPQVLHLSAAHSYILEKVSNMLVCEGLSPDMHETHLAVLVEDFSSTVRLLGSSHELTELECQNIFMLPLPPGTDMSYGLMHQSRTLEGWYTLERASDLIWVLDNGSLTVHFQPIVEAVTMEIYAYECLARGVLSSGQLMSPGAMFDTACKTGMLFNLDRQCRESAIKTAAVKNIHKNIFINFLPSSIYNPEYCLRDTEHWARQLDFNPYSIVFEVVETERVESLEHLKGILGHYKSRGFRTALDDIGSGYASLSLFASLAPDIVKIDMELVRDIHRSEVKQSVARALISMAKDIGTKVLAEGVENCEESDWFRAQGVDYLQGYYFGKPSPEPLRQLAVV
ncbi:EAL domain-containing protein (putative c-di-GMP-specific phosphodiesterase class I) [Desulfurispira natronophila]|uniref:EAL domain-containing protein (Putative c-di-GMP-specific phosphodiesterase class I) n=2 Tax=Desulfurispira natronophila TaxID=682562 RepID=A0A7W8DGK9_9BACT|nr:EAL domain-containing protein (putative c-di-GMP-specific phosphodiesterase class I) [Desulfurispira natronophila]